jgi:hypothetical protein
MLIAAGKHYICVEEISSIRCIEIKSIAGNVLSQEYDFNMKNSEDFRVTAKEFDNFKTNCGRLSIHVF